MLTWLWRLLVVGFPSKPGMNALRARVESVEKLVDNFVSEVKEQRGRITTALRSRGIKRPDDEVPDATQSLQDAPQSTNPRAVAYDRPTITKGGPRAARSNYGG